jgi:hypothetical protein
MGTLSPLGANFACCPGLKLSAQPIRETIADWRSEGKKGVSAVDPTMLSILCRSWFVLPGHPQSAARLSKRCNCTGVVRRIFGFCSRDANSCLCVIQSTFPACSHFCVVEMDRAKRFSGLIEGERVRIIFSEEARLCPRPPWEDASAPIASDVGRSATYDISPGSGYHQSYRSSPPPP